ncbi:hypothetical protein HK097_008911 [Rhizophlyctis rosea]|uniref:G-protein coupled receptors family 3 profile domain-containing protein n=1 Tax=Rhizophlyctis rosea TaxID=64517 RepID=A0AAD5X3M7_9FUNG|nr:hypothetical protein HK097_008911 [Rhizophlyctis rosea]
MVTTEVLSQDQWPDPDLKPLTVSFGSSYGSFQMGLNWNYSPYANGYFTTEYNSVFDMLYIWVRCDTDGELLKRFDIKIGDAAGWSGRPESIAKSASSIAEGDTPFVTGQWTRLAINITEKVQANYQANYKYKFNWFVIQTNVKPLSDTMPVKFYMAAYLTNTQAANLPPTGYVDPPGTTIIPPSADVFLTDDQTYADEGDSGTLAQWICTTAGAKNLDARGYQDLGDVFLHGFRDTVNGPVPMVTTTNVQFVASPVAQFKISYLWAGTARETFYAYDYPNPMLACTLHNADFFEIGNTTKANYTMVVWAPILWNDLPHVLGAYAQFVKSKRDPVTGQDTVAVHLRTRVPNSYGLKGGVEWAWVTSLMPDCSTSAPFWHCPDHIWFMDHQMGWLHAATDVLAPLASHALKWMKETSYNFMLDLHTAPSTLITYENDVYAVPLTISMFPWRVNMTTITARGLKPPPGKTGANWGASWWTAWTMETFNEYIDVMYEHGHRNILPLATNNNGDTELAQFFNLFYGSTMMNTDGRCGLDTKAEIALNNTIVKWSQMSDIFTLRAANQPAEFAAWKDKERLPNPLDEPALNFYDISNGKGEGFQLKAYTSDFAVIYPPTGVGEAWTMSAGLARRSRWPELGFEALMKVVATNERLQVNTPQPQSGSLGGISAFKSVKYSPEYQVKKTDMEFWFQYADHVMYQGYPATQSAYWSQVLTKNPLGLAYKDILYKGASAKEEISRVCAIVDYYSRPPCNEKNMVAKLQNNEANNKATVIYEYEPNYTYYCNPNLYGAKKIPDPIVNALPTSFTSSRSTTGKAMMAISAAGIGIELVLLILFIVKRDAPVIKAAARGPSYLIFLGAMLTLASVIMRVSADGDLKWSNCFGTYWLFSIGYAMVLGSLAVKSYRVDAIFRNRKASFSFSDAKVMILIASVVLGDVIISFMYQFWVIDSSRTQLTTIPLTDLTFTQTKCPTIHETPTVLYYLYNALLLLVAAIFAFRTRNVVSTFNENTFTAAAIGLITVISIVIVPVLNLVTSSEAQYLLIGLGTFLATVLSTVIFAVPKLLVAFEVLRLGGAPTTTTVMAKTGMTSSSPDSSNVGARSSVRGVKASV